MEKNATGAYQVMIFTNFSMTSVSPASHLATTVSGPPAMFTANPNSPENTISGKALPAAEKPGKVPHSEEVDDQL